MTITEPTMTGNAALLLGFVAAKIGPEDGRDADWFFVTGADPSAGTITVEARGSGNVFQLAVVQIGGIE